MNDAQFPDDYDVAGWQLFYQNNPNFHRSVGADGDGGSDDGGSDDGGDTPDVSELVASAVDEAVSGLKRTNKSLKEEKRELAKRLEGLTSSFEKLGGDEGIESLLKMKTNLEKDELGKLLAEGKHDEWFDQRTSAMRKDYENQMAKQAEQYEGASQQITSLRDQLRSTILQAEVLSAAKDAGTLPEAAADIQLRAERAFSFDEERNQLVIKDEDGGVLFGKDGKTPKGVSEWLEEQKEAARHWWPASRGAGAGGSGEPSNGDADLGKMSFRDFKKHREEQRKSRSSY